MKPFQIKIPEIKENDDTDRMIVVGNTVPSGHTAGRIFDPRGISPTVMYRNSKVIQIYELFEVD